jgi:hypothetical protein
MAIHQSTAITMTATCEANLCGINPCKGVIFSLTDAHLTDCQHGCHVPAPVADDELEIIAELEADRALEAALELAHFGADL